MRRYVIITPNLTNMGGAQMYVRNKSVYMQEKGWNVGVISQKQGKIYIDDLIKYDVIIPDLAFSPYLYTTKKQQNIIEKCCGYICDDKYEEIIIESSCLWMAEWSELIARRCNARHLFFSLMEINKIDSEVSQQFVIFKHKRKEIAGISSVSLFNMFAPFHPINEDASYCLPAYCTNVVDNVDSDLVNNVKFSDYKYVIACFARLNKPFVLPAIRGVAEFASAYPDEKLLLVVIGGETENEYANRIKKIVQSAKNIDLIITGFIFPIPAKLFDYLDVILSSAGCASIGNRSGVPTISFDGRDCKPIGVMGRTTPHSLFRGVDEPPLELSSLMTDILIGKKFEKINPAFETTMDFSVHDSFFSQMAEKKEYFDFSKVSLSMKEHASGLILSMPGGGKIYILISKLKQKIKSALDALRSTNHNTLPML